MNIICLYTHVLGRSDEHAPSPSSYDWAANRFKRTYIEFKPDEAHDLIILDCGAEHKDGKFSGLANGYLTYNGRGWDCGAFQYAAERLHCDMLVTFSAFTHFWRTDWLRHYIAAWQKHGPGLYGATASFERHPHIRGNAQAFCPEFLRTYPVTVDSRAKTYEMEAGPSSLTSWAVENSYPVFMVAASGIWKLEDCRIPDNVFRRGDQSEVLVYDRHTDIYQAACPEEKAKLEALANGVK